MKISKDCRTIESKKYKKTWKNVKIGELIIISYDAMSGVTVFVYVVSKLMALVLHLNERNYDSSKKPMLFESKFYFGTQINPIFELTWIFQFISLSIAVSSIAVIDSFFIFSTLYLCDQLTYLRFDLEEWLIKPDEKRFFIKALGSIVERHLDLFRYSRFQFQDK